MSAEEEGGFEALSPEREAQLREIQARKARLEGQYRQAREDERKLEHQIKLDGLRDRIIAHQKAVEPLTGLRRSVMEKHAPHADFPELICSECGPFAPFPCETYILARDYVEASGE